MATLPYSVRVELSDPTQFKSIQDWCFSLWSHTHQMTWSSGWVVPPLTGLHKYSRTWYFQREEDARLFAITWS